VVNVGVSVDGVLPIGARTRRTHGENILRLSVEGDENSCVCTEVNPRTMNPRNLQSANSLSMGGGWNFVRIRRGAITMLL
jgi:hypothetical protein